MPLGDIPSGMHQGIMTFPPDPHRSLGTSLLSVLLSQLIPKVGCRFPQGWGRAHTTYPSSAPSIRPTVAVGAGYEGDAPAGD